MAGIASLALWFAPLFTTQGVLTALMDGDMRGRFQPPRDAGRPTLSSQSPWAYALRNGMRFGVVLGLGACVLSARAATQTVTPAAFASRLALAGALLCGFTAWQVSGTFYLQEARVPRDRRGFRGTLRSYLVWRHALPQGVINAVINFAVTYAIFPAVVAGPSPVVPVAAVVRDTLFTAFLLNGIIGVGVTTHARVDSQWGIAPRLDAQSLSGFPASRAWRVVAAAVAVSLATTFAVGLALHLSGVEGLGVHGWAAGRAVVFGLYPAWLAYVTARWSVARAQR